MKTNILLIEDDQLLSSSLKRFLSLRGYSVSIEYDGLKGYGHILRNNSELDLVILDINLPRLSGLDICHQVRKSGIKLPIIILTKELSTDIAVNAFDRGANDYVRKPFDMQELEARIQSQLKNGDAISKTLQAGEFLIDLSCRKVLRDGVEINLRRKEFDLLVYLVRNKNFALSRDKIIANVWNFDEDPYPNTVDAHISFLRKKLNDKDQQFIETVHGIGYRLNI